MRDARFIRRLEKALPEWAKSGFLSAEGAKDILAFEKERAGGGIPYLTVALAILGVLLLGSGIISFFAANWQWLPKIAKLVVLFGGMWAAYAIAGYMLGRGARPLVGQAVLLLGVLLFGANIWLVAQIYHTSRRITRTACSFGHSARCSPVICCVRTLRCVRPHCSRSCGPAWKVSDSIVRCTGLICCSGSPACRPWFGIAGVSPPMPRQSASCSGAGRPYITSKGRRAEECST